MLEKKNSGERVVANKPKEIKMKVIYISLMLLVFWGGEYVLKSLQKQKITTVTIDIKKNKCDLIEIGSGYKTNYVKFKGRVWEKEDPHYECSVEIPEKKFKKTLGNTCVLSGFNRTSVYLYKGKMTALRGQSCDFRQLRNGTFYFNAGGIVCDACTWTCF